MDTETRHIQPDKPDWRRDWETNPAFAQMREDSDRADAIIAAMEEEMGEPVPQRAALKCVLIRRMHGMAGFIPGFDDAPIPDFDHAPDKDECELE